MARRTRFAPSPTGFLHAGHALHMEFVWAMAEKMGAEILCRMEDHDRSRWRPEFEPAILEDMQWLGFVPDLGLRTGNAPHPSAYRQSDCLEEYENRLEFLREKGLVYGCACSRKEIAQRQGISGGELCYDGACEEKDLPLEGHTVRFRVPKGNVIFQDLKCGTCTQAPATQCGDFSLRDRTGQWTYQFCCVCDDIRHGIDLVIRGEDLLESTGRQIFLFEAFGAQPPAYLHHPLLLDSAEKKLSKRTHSESLRALRDAGVRLETIREEMDQRVRAFQNQVDFLLGVKPLLR